MSDQNIEQTSDTDIRTLSTIRNDAVELDDRRLNDLIRPLEDVRHKARTLTDNFQPDSPAWVATVDEVTPLLDEAEQKVLSELEGVRRHVLADRQALTNQTYVSGLPASQATAADARAASISVRLENMTVDQVNQALEAAVLRDDPVELSAWALNGAALRNRAPERTANAFPKIVSKSLLAECETRTGDREVVRTRETVEKALASVNDRIRELTEARAAHQPGNVGSLLLNYQFGGRSQEQAQHERKYDPGAVATRLGRSA